MRKIYASGKRVYGRTLNILFLESPQPRMAVTITRKAGNAVYRNRQKRRVREIYRTHKSLFPAVDLIFHVKPLAKEPEYQDYLNDIIRLAPRINRINKS